jgi:hypothetical protein
MEKKTAPFLLDECRGRVQALESSLPKHLDAMDVSRTAKLPWKALLSRESLSWRMAELARSALESFENDKLVAGVTLARAAVETTAALWYLWGKLAAAVESNVVGDIEDPLMKLGMGIATEPPDTAMPRPVKVGAFFKAVEKDLPGFSQQYGMLSEYAHPNWHGTGLLYCKHDVEQRTTEFGHNLRRAENTKVIGLSNLSVALLLFETSYKRIAELIPAFTALCEWRLKQHASAADY